MVPSDGAGANGDESGGGGEDHAGGDGEGGGSPLPQRGGAGVAAGPRLWRPQRRRPGGLEWR